MSYFEDVEAYCIYDMDELYERYFWEAQEGFWTMKNGEQIHVSKMSDNHLRNCINMMERNDERDLMLPWIERMKEELESR